MISFMGKRKKSVFSKIASAFLVLTFGLAMVLPPAPIFAETVMNLPAAGKLVPLSPEFTAATVKGMVIHPEDALKFDFIIDSGDTGLKGDEFKDESMRIIKYFLATLTVPEDELWVNLSPYDKDRIVTDSFGRTEMGIDLLAQDYILKQLTASLMYPESDMGKKFWDRIYQKAHDLYGTTNIPVNTFNKVWIIPDKAVVYESGNAVVIKESHLKVMLEEDYLNVKNNLPAKQAGSGKLVEKDAKQLSNMSSDIVREILLPEIEKEVNEGANFAKLRQIYSAIILAAWYKNNLRETILGQVYVNKNKTGGVETADANVKEKIYSQYLSAFKKGAYNIIKEDTDKYTNQPIPRRYFSGGVAIKNKVLNLVTNNTFKATKAPTVTLQKEIAAVVDAAMVSTASRVTFRLGVRNNDSPLGTSRIINVRRDVIGGLDIATQGTTKFIALDSIMQKNGTNLKSGDITASKAAIALMSVDPNFSQQEVDSFLKSKEVDLTNVPSNLRDQIHQTINSGIESKLQLTNIPDASYAVKEIKNPMLRNQLSPQNLKTSIDTLTSDLLSSSQGNLSSVLQNVRDLSPESPQLRKVFPNINTSEIPAPVFTFIQAKVADNVSNKLFENQLKQSVPNLNFQEMTTQVASNLQNAIGNKRIALSPNEVNAEYHSYKMELIKGKEIPFFESNSNKRRDDVQLSKLTNILRNSIVENTTKRQSSRLAFPVSTLSNAKAVVNTSIGGNIDIGEFNGVIYRDSESLKQKPIGEIRTARLTPMGAARARANMDEGVVSQALNNAVKASEKEVAPADLKAVESVVRQGLQSNLPLTSDVSQSDAFIMADVMTKIARQKSKNLVEIQNTIKSFDYQNTDFRNNLALNEFDTSKLTQPTVDQIKSIALTASQTSFSVRSNLKDSNLYEVANVVHRVASSQAGNKPGDVLKTLQSLDVKNPSLQSALFDSGFNADNLSQSDFKQIVSVAAAAVETKLPATSSLSEGKLYEVANVVHRVASSQAGNKPGDVLKTLQSLDVKNPSLQSALFDSGFNADSLSQSDFDQIVSVATAAARTESNLSKNNIFKLASATTRNLIEEAKNPDRSQSPSVSLQLPRASKAIPFVNAKTEDVAAVQEQFKQLAGLNNVGGIDFNPSALDLKINRDGNGVALPMNLQSIDEMNIDGFTPVILDIKPAGTVVPPMILGEAGSGRQPLKPAAALKKL